MGADVKEGALAALGLVCVLALAATTVGAKAPSEVVIQGIGLPTAIRVSDPSAVLPFFDLTTGEGQETPAPGTVLTYRYVVYLLLPGETLDIASWQFFFEPSPTSGEAYFFRVRTVETNVWTTLVRLPGLDTAMVPYLMPGVGQDAYAVGDPAPVVPAPVEIRDVGSVGVASPVLWIVAIGAAVFLAGLILRLPKRMRSR